ncbi:MAG: NADPH:quinone reductase [Rhodobacter sp.]|nr:NADPH:quinone reductase [Rhodobacter sp.]
MRAVEYTARGPAAQVLRLVDLPVPTPGTGEVLVQVMVSAVNPSDTKGRTARPHDSAMPFPAVTPHQDGSGVITATGPGVDPARIGQRVWLYMANRGRPRGTAAEFCVVPDERAVPLPAAASFAQGACLGIPAMTAHYALMSDGPLTAKVVLVQGGAGAVGFYAVQIAKWADAALVIATVSRPEQAAQARLAGADLVIDRKTQDFVAAIRAAAPRGVDRVIEVAFGTNLADDLAVLARNGVIAAYASDAAPEPAVNFRALMAKDATVRFVLIYEAPQSARDAAARDINAMIAAGTLHHQIAQTLPLSAVIPAHEAMESGRLVGKILLDLTA